MKKYRLAIMAVACLVTLLLSVKVTGLAQISWLWVLSPIWLPFVLTLAASVCIFLFLLVAYKDRQE